MELNALHSSLHLQAGYSLDEYLSQNMDPLGSISQTKEIIISFSGKVLETSQVVHWEKFFFLSENDPCEMKTCFALIRKMSCWAEQLIKCTYTPTLTAHIENTEVVTLHVSHFYNFFFPDCVYTFHCKNPQIHILYKHLFQFLQTNLW